MWKSTSNKYRNLLVCQCSQLAPLSASTLIWMYCMLRNDYAWQHHPAPHQKKKNPLKTFSPVFSPFILKQHQQNVSWQQDAHMVKLNTKSFLMKCLYQTVYIKNCNYSTHETQSNKMKVVAHVATAIQEKQRSLSLSPICNQAPTIPYREMQCVWKLRASSSTGFNVCPNRNQLQYSEPGLILRDWRPKCYIVVWQS